MSSVQANGHAARPRGGRPSKGDRADLMVRVPTPLRAVFARDAADRGVSQSDLMSEILEARYSAKEEEMMRQSA